MKVKIYALVDNCASNVAQAEHGLSYLVEYDSTVLFDAGQSDLFLKNAKVLEVPISDVSHVVLSHGHYDHGNGLTHFGGKPLVCHPQVFTSRFTGKQRKPIGIKASKAELASKYNLVLSDGVYKLSPNMYYLGQIPRTVSFENQTQTFYLENNEPDPLTDDSALAITTSKGLFIVSGCAHAGICNTIVYAQNITGVKKVWGVFGGFHLKLANKQTQQTIEFIKALEPEIVMPAHCTELPALAEFYKVFGGEQVKAGTLYTFDAG
jgi:7,8-dihydropterin-6-yl-methyl-4-(beta-D-ribofuranosyl)aminobenzene 5'-phosphate synthase